VPPISACRTASPSTNGASAWRRGLATRSAPPSTRGGATNSRAAVYAIEKWDEWLRNYAPPGAADLDFYQSLPALSQGNIAQQIFWYTAFTANMVQSQAEGNNTVDEDGTPLWRMAPSPYGPYWKEGCSAATKTSAPGPSSR
jgi:glycerol transport system substrate-binding protein